MSGSKRRTGGETAAEAEKAKYVRLIDEELRQLVGGRKLLLESDLTKADLLEFLKAKGFIRGVKGVMEVMVQTLSGGSFGVMLEDGGTVADLKSEIQEAQGAAPYRQQLFMLGEGTEGVSEMQEPLLDALEIRASCTVILCVQVEEEWSWDASSPLLERKVFELRGPDNSIVTKIDQNANGANCMMVGPVLEGGTGKHTISTQLEGVNRPGCILCGVVSDGAGCDERHSFPESAVGWFMDSYDGSLCGNGKFDDDEAGRIKSGDVLTMQVDTDTGTLKFWVNGEPHGPGYASGVRGPLRWATSISDVNNSVAIVPTPAVLLPWSSPANSSFDSDDSDSDDSDSDDSDSDDQETI